MAGLSNIDGAAKGRAAAVAGRAIPSLDGVRCLAILMVLLHHSFSVSAQTRWPVLYAVLGDGSLGVSIFFVLSGYLITSILLREKAAHGSINFGRFYRRRMLRLLPALYVYIATLAALSWLGRIGVNPWNLLFAATGVYNYLSIPTGTPEIAHSWSLSAEWQFYVLWPLVLLRARDPRRVALGIIVAEPLIRALTQLTPGRARMGMMIHTQADLLLWGCLLALYWNSPQLAQWERRFMRPGILFGAALFLFLVSPVLSVYGRGAYSVLIGQTLVGPLVALLLCWVVRRPSTSIGRILNHPIAARIGLISYSVYLWQQLIVWESSALPVGRAIARYLLLFVIAMASYWSLERFRGSVATPGVTKDVAAART